MKEKLYNIGHLIIHCDTRGATTDIAVSTIAGPERLNSWLFSKTITVGTVSIQKHLWRHISQALRRARSQSPEQLALEMNRSSEAMDCMAKFTTGVNSGRCIAILLPACIQRSSSAEARTLGKPTFQGRKFCIHR